MANVYETKCYVQSVNLKPRNGLSWSRLDLHKKYIIISMFTPVSFQHHVQDSTASQLFELDPLSRISGLNFHLSVQFLFL